MVSFNLKPHHKPVREYYTLLKTLDRKDLQAEGQVAPAFATLLRHCGKKLDWTLAEQFSFPSKDRTLRLDGALLDQFNMVRGVWEAKDVFDNLNLAIEEKFKTGYPRENIIFQTPKHAVIWQNGREVWDRSLAKPTRLVEALEIFFSYEAPQQKEWERAVEKFKSKIPELGSRLLEKIETEAKENSTFSEALEYFTQLCRDSLNPNLSYKAVEEMLIQHLLTERIFRRVFDNPDFVKRNIIAQEIEKVIAALTSRAFNRNEFLQELDPFYTVLEKTARTIHDFSLKQSFLNTVYEKFFQGFSIRVADTHGIVYTPQPIVNFMVRSVDEILIKEFGRSLSDKGVHILEPFVGTGNFVINIMRQIKKTALEYKFAEELHCNEIMLLPYYISSMNIEHEYYKATGKYKAFEGICLVDTFELAEGRQERFDFMNAENSKRVNKQQKTPIFVVIGNPPYNVGQANENDNNKNRKYDVIDQRVRETYSRASKATNKNALSDVYVKAFRWASDRVLRNGEGVVAFVSNNSFLNDYAFDGMRKCLEKDFDRIYILDLGGNVRKNPKLSGTTHNVFGIQVGVGISFLIKSKSPSSECKIFYSRVDEYWRKVEKYDYLDEKRDWSEISWREITPDSKHTWLTDGLNPEFNNFLPLGTKDEPENSIFHLVSNGVKTNRDSWVYNFNRTVLAQNIKSFIETYNKQVYEYSRIRPHPQIDTFVISDDTKIKWSRDLKLDLKRGRTAEFSEAKIRQSLYRPFTKTNLFFDPILNEEVYQFPNILPTQKVQSENRVICLSGVGSSKPFQTLVVNFLPCLDLLEKTQCFPYYVYSENGGKRYDNIDDLALRMFKAHYSDAQINKWEIFYYVYGILQHPLYCEKYAANLRRELPRIPLAIDFWQFSKTGKELAELHIGYENQSEHKLDFVEAEDKPLNWRVEKMKFSKDKTAIIYNDFLTLKGIPPETFDYRLGTRSALEWIVDQYRIKTDKRSGIVNDPNRSDDPQYIVRLIGKIITVSLKTVNLVKSLPELKVN